MTGTDICFDINILFSEPLNSNMDTDNSIDARLKAGMRKIRNIEFNYEDCEALLNPGTKPKGPANAITRRRPSGLFPLMSPPEMHLSMSLSKDAAAHISTVQLLRTSQSLSFAFLGHVVQ